MLCPAASAKSRPQTRYINKLISKQYESKVITMDRCQSIGLNSIRNARELGGYLASDGRKVRSGVLLRTACLYGISQEDEQKLTDVYRLAHIVDFRMPMELNGSADPPLKRAEYHHLNVIDLSRFPAPEEEEIDVCEPDIVQAVKLSEQIGAMDGRMYVGFLASQTGKDAYAEFFRILLSCDPDRAVLWHCTSGKDRTGLAAMLLLYALGVDEETIMQDYLLTNEYNADRIEGTKMHLRSQGFDDEFIFKANLVLSAVDERIMRITLSYLKKEYGSVVGYIRGGLALTQADIDSLKEKYLV